MIRAALLLLIGLALASPAGAQVQPQPGNGDPHVRLVEYKPDQVVQLDVAVGYVLSLELASDDPILNIAVGDPATWQASMSKSQDRIYVQALLAGSNSNMTVVTANRRYLFNLSATAGASPDMAYAVRFRYGTGQQTEPDDTAPQTGCYKLSGARELMPSAISDDGTHTSIIWPPDALLPAVFAIDDQGHESVVNGNMRKGVYVIDSTNRLLAFRIDKRVARARSAPCPRKDK